jgi:hypothetical protein
MMVLPPNFVSCEICGADATCYQGGVAICSPCFDRAFTLGVSLHRIRMGLDLLKAAELHDLLHDQTRPRLILPPLPSSGDS